MQPAKSETIIKNEQFWAIVVSMGLFPNHAKKIPLGFQGDTDTSKMP